ncbi:Putative short-chain type dehydrogenase/reductase Rv0148 [Achromobacter denitrificans]|uniref:SDR family oxidoreductase n=1 Tax=Achromobacter denitrificans TaxID=32002 RepID=UPI0007889B04|nr:SDR family oxidoreductase [Achromobacter denitrificans]OLU07767.1 short-chain dehydrogenase [Achromobacter denitrificans]QKH41142.1 SDR family NAD(P)-dependent oxidoreductase [Achromobacter denitrificans]QKH51713.1 SDR family NAD(P)-dependent oxidoreductase [Achromobacter denitrificans]CAB3721120.1 Putative short-chain type dehydrogenase/reductase [Achromobacter denitrificans]SUU27936.1 Putative short-chain type dehydrogenase/reductase Rv0148 [Achromobacter denitrificans]
MSLLCKDRVVIVTGAGRGIGREYALQLARQGACVVVNDLSVSRSGEDTGESTAAAVVREIVEGGGQAVANHENVADFAGARRMIEAALDHFGALHGLVNNAGILRDRTLCNMSEEEWDAVIDVHLKGTFAPCRHAAAYWRDLYKQTGEPVNARIVNTSSSSGLYGNIGQINYGAAKAGIAAMTIIAARELKRYGVTVNAINPHAQTRMTEGIRERSAEEIEARHPRWIAPAVAWLASADSHDVTGRIFELGGGHLAAMEGWRRGPAADPIDDVARIGPVMRDLAERARRNVDMKGHDLD